MTTRTASVALLLAACLAGLWWRLLVPGAPTSSPILFDGSGALPPPGPGRLAGAGHGGPCVRLAFVGDIMQHRGQAAGDYRASYGRIAPRLRTFDLAVGNLEFPVDPRRPVGPEPGGVRFNGAGSHLDALAGAGFDALVLANNHAFDQGEEGVRRTLQEVERRGMLGLGTARDRAGLEAPRIVDVAGIRLGLAAYSRPLNAYPDARGEYRWPGRDLPVLVVNFPDWTGEYREQGKRLFREQAAAARRARAELLVALVHWGEEWHFGASPDQRLAARDLIDAGFDLVVGAHPHVLGPAEVYRGRLIAYSLGNFASAFRPLPTRTGALLEIGVLRAAEGTPVIAGFEFHPLLVRDGSHLVQPLGDGGDREERAAWELARQVLGPVSGFQRSACRTR